MSADIETIGHRDKQAPTVFVLCGSRHRDQALADCERLTEALTAEAVALELENKSLSTKYDCL